jgi:hypothetical protein
MAEKFLKLVSGELQNAEALVASSGAPDAGKIVGLGTDGKFDMSVLPAGAIAFDPNTILTGPTDCLYATAEAPLDILIDDDGNVLIGL